MLQRPINFSAVGRVTPDETMLAIFTAKKPESSMEEGQALIELIKRKFSI